MIISREFEIVENIRLICLLDLTADFGVKTNAKLTLHYRCVKNIIYNHPVIPGLSSVPAEAPGALAAARQAG